ncbi:MAG: glutamate racemase [Chlamydiia bacterium]
MSAKPFFSPNPSIRPCLGMIDSGLGGLSVLRVLSQAGFAADILYLGDTARVPYGSRSPETIRKWTLECASWLLSQGAQALMIACHTSSCSGAASLIRQALAMPVVDMAEGTQQALLASSSSGPIVVLSTEATLRTRIYELWAAEHLPQRSYLGIACPMLVPLVEEGLAYHPAARCLIEHYLEPLSGMQPGTLLLGCTHYPALTSLIQEHLGQDWEIIDPAQYCLGWLRALAPERGALDCLCHCTSDPVSFQKRGEALLQAPLGSCRLVQLTEEPVEVPTR